MLKINITDQQFHLADDLSLVSLGNLRTVSDNNDLNDDRLF